MDRPLGSSGSCGGGSGEGVVSSGGSATGPISTVSEEDEMVFSSEVSSSLREDSEVELGFGLSLGNGGTMSSAAKLKSCAPRILTAEDLPPVVSLGSSISGTKAHNGVSQVVGWPPVRTSRMNNLLNQAKSSVSGDCNSTYSRNKAKSVVPVKIDRSKTDDSAKGLQTYLFVKVNMDRMPIGRKVDLNAHICYTTLAHTLDDMFCRPHMTINAGSSYLEEDGAVTDPTGSLRLLDESSEYVLTYEDKEGDWMLVGDVPWEMFISSVKRLRIMRWSEANGLSPRSQERNERGRSKLI